MREKTMGCLETLVKGALLHDIGKVVYRANEGSGDHSTAGATFLRSYTEDKELLRCVQYHRGKQLSKATIPDTSLAYLVYEADNLASALDRREFDEGEMIEGQTFDKNMPLTSVFHTFGGRISKNEQKYHLRGLDVGDNYNYPKEGTILATSDTYKMLYQTMKDKFTAQNIDDMTVNELLRIYEDTTSFIPFTTYKKEIADTSLYIHSKLTAAIATCMQLYFEENHITDYRKYCFTDSKTFREQEAFMMISGDVSGIQDFIYTVPSTGALKSLRGRSVYLEILLESIIDSLLEDLNLTRCNVLYSGGGHFYILSHATETTVEIVNLVEASVNQWLLEHVGTKLYIAFGMAICTGNDLINGEKQHKLFGDVRQNSDKGKVSRYTKENLVDLFNPNSTINLVKDGDKECSICHTSSVHLKPYVDTGALACCMCDSLYRLGEVLVQPEESVLGIAETQAVLEKILSIPIYSNYDANLYVISKRKLEELDDSAEWKRLYIINGSEVGGPLANRLWIADYVTRKPDGSVYTFEELANLSGAKTTGIQRLGVLRADVDNLGAAFISGFISDNKETLFQFNRFSRYADLSRTLSMFFKVGVNKIVAGNVNGVEDIKDTYRLWSGDTSEKGHIHIIYSGGDDVFLVGPWDELIEVAIDIRNRLKDLTGGKITMSAGLGMFTHHFPITKMAEITGNLESTAKDMPEKDSIALFGFDTHNEGQPLICHHVYTWDQFIDSVLGEKFTLLQSLLGISKEGIVTDMDKIPFRLSFMYRIMELLEELVKENSDGIHRARLLYTLARMEPQRASELQKEAYRKFVTKMYEYTQSKEVIKTSGKELLTALHILIYCLRGKEKMEEQNV